MTDLNIYLNCKDCKDPIPNIFENFAAGEIVCGNCGIYYYIIFKFSKYFFFFIFQVLNNF